MDNTIFFLHGLDSSGNGTKGRFFREHFPEIKRPNFTGDLATRLEALKEQTGQQDNLILIGSSFGGLMATYFAIDYPEKVTRLILLAPALNFEDYRPPSEKNKVPSTLYIGKNDEVTPVNPVVELAQETFKHLTVHLEEDDHFLHRIFQTIPWQHLLNIKH